MIFVLEGVDKSGKTTLAAKLCKEYDAVYLKFSAPKRNACKEYSDCLDMLKVDRNYVLDRFCYGELLYGPLYRQKSGITLNDLRYLEIRMLSFDPVVIGCLTKAEQIKSNFTRCKEELTKPQHIDKLIKGYKALLGSHDRLLPVLWYDYLKDPEHEELFYKLQLTVFTQPLLCQSDLSNYVGATYCRYLFVADEKNKNRLDHGVLDSTSGHYLFKLLEKLKVLNLSGFCNSLVGHELVDLDMIKRLEPTKVLALGKQASKRLDLLGIEHTQLGHPQFAKRFYGKGGATRYTKEIKKGLGL